MNISCKPSATTSVARTLKKQSLKRKKTFELNSTNFLDTLFKKTQSILTISFIWNKFKKIGTLGRMLKKGDPMTHGGEKRRKRVLKLTQQ